MEDIEKTKDQLIHELRQRITELEASEEDRQWMEKVLHETKEGYQMLVETMNDGLAVQDEDGLLLYVNRRLCDMLGYSEGELIERPVTSLLDETNQRILSEEMVRRRKGESGFYEMEYIGKDGKKIPAIVSSRPVIDADGHFMGSFAVITDISERKEMEEALRESEELHRITLSNISDAVFITKDDGTFTYICPNVDEIFGYSFEDVREFGQITKLLGDDLFDYNELGTSREIQNIERQITDKFGEPHVLWVNVKRVSIKGGTVLYSCRDITDRRRVEEQLRQYQ